MTSLGRGGINACLPSPRPIPVGPAMPPRTLRDLEGHSIQIHDLPEASDYLLCNYHNADGTTLYVVIPCTRAGKALCRIPMDRMALLSFIRELERVLEMH